MQEKPLCQILSLFWGVTAAAHVRIEWIPVDFVKLAEGCLETRCLALRREQHHAPPSRVKSVLIVPDRDLVLLQLSALKDASYNVHPKFEAKLFAKQKLGKSLMVCAPFTNAVFFALI
jgi:hypothetical protein